MSLREQLLKSGLANKEQAKKAEKEAKKRQHQLLQPQHAGQDAVSQDIVEGTRRQHEADRLRNLALDEQRRQREAIHRAMDIMISSDLRDSTAQIPYYFIFQEHRISEIMVTDMQQTQLASGLLAIVSFDPDFRYFLVDRGNAEKIRNCAPQFLLCWHEPS